MVRVEGPSGEKKLLGRLEVDVVGVVVGREGEVKLGSNSGQAGLQTKGELLSCLALSYLVVSCRVGLVVLPSILRIDPQPPFGICYYVPSAVPRPGPAPGVDFDPISPGGSGSGSGSSSGRERTERDVEGGAGAGAGAGDGTKYR